MVQAPTLVTDRLTLSAHRADDLAPLSAMWAAAEVYSMIGGQPRASEDVWIRLLRSIGQWTLLGYGAWVVRDRENGRLLGEVGLIEAKRPINPPLSVPEVGWTLIPAAHGRGIASEAMKAVLFWADDQRIMETCCIIDPANQPSIRLAETLGYSVARESLYHDRLLRIFTRTNLGFANAGREPQLLS